MKLDRPALDMSSEESNPQELSERRNRIYSHFVLRRLGRWCLPGAVKLGLSPNQVSAAALVVTVAGMGLLAVGGAVFSIAGILTVHLGLVLDNLDGDLARLTTRTSRRGEFLDAIMGYFYGAMVLPAVGIGVARAPDLGYDMMSKIVEFQSEVFTDVGVWSGFIFLSSRLVSLRHRAIFEQSVGEGSANIRRVALNILDFLPFFLVLGAVTRSMSVVLIAFVIFHVASLLYITLTSFARAGSDPAR